MKKAILPRLVAAALSVAVALVLFDQVATMGNYADPQTAASADLRPIGQHVAAAGR